MKLLVIGSGGREHTIVWALHHTATTALDVYCAPGNAGIGQVARLVPVPVLDHNALARFAESEQIDLTIVGPEAPLAAGIVDLFKAYGLPIVGPSQAASRLEASKIFAKDFMARHGIPTAIYRVAESADEAVRILRSGEFAAGDGPVVIKADGLAAGKGVVVAGSRGEAEQAVADLMVKHVAGAEAAERVIIEEALHGREASVLLFVDGQDYVLMPPARDHKRIGDNDAGPNTGGMGTVTDDSVLHPDLLQRVVAEIVEPTVAGAREEGFPFQGILFLGLMLTDEGPKLLEYIVRFADPETQEILVRLKTDLLTILEGMRTGTLGRVGVQWAPGASACVVAASRGYPGKHDAGAVISGLGQAETEGVKVFHAGTAQAPNGEIIATGGRVLGVTAAASNLPEALRLCYRSLEKIHWDGMQYRRDIGRSGGT